MMEINRKRGSFSRVRFGLTSVILLSLQVCAFQNPSCAFAQQSSTLPERIQKIGAAMAATQKQLEQSQRELDELRRELAELQREMPNGGANANGPAPQEAGAETTVSSAGTTEDLAAAVQEIRERQALQESQIATHEQTKVETASKYPLKITGLILMNGFVNTGAVNQPSTPSIAVAGAGSVGASVRQTLLGLDARGPHLFGAESFADLRMDFAGEPAYNAASSLNYPTYIDENSISPRLRTVHAGLEWSRAQAYFQLDRPILSPDTPSSLTAVAEPALAWSGNLWAWNPQAVFGFEPAIIGAATLQVQAALIDPADAPLSPEYSTQAIQPPNSVEQSSRPGVEAHIALLGSGEEDKRNHIGVGGYFARHSTPVARTFDAWAGTMDARFQLPLRLEFSGSFYRGLGLGGLGEGGYKDYVYKPNPNTGGYFFKALDDVGGWAQLKERFGERLELNGAYGMDNLFSGQMRRYVVNGGTMYQNLTINRALTGNVIYSPSAFLLFSFEYRRIKSAPIAASAVQSDVFGIAAGYKF